MRWKPILISSVMAAAVANQAARADNSDELAKQLANPISSLISFPFQFNVDFGAGPDGDARTYNLKVQPVVPIKLNEQWNVISRTIMPFAGNTGFPGGDVRGIGDTTESLFFSPRMPGPSGIIWGAGPIFLLPTGTDPSVGSGHLGVGPTGVVLKQTGTRTLGILASQTWSIWGDDTRPPVSSLFLQPFLSYTLGMGRSITLNSETSYDWIGHQWVVPINLVYTKVFKVHERSMSYFLGGRWYPVKPSGGATWGVRAGLTLLFPTGS